MSNSENERRITALEHEAATLRAEIANLRGRPAPVRFAPAPVAEPEGPRIFTPPPDPGKFVMPSELELRELLAVVVGKYPKLGPDLSNRRYAEDDELEYFRGFCAAFRRIGYLGRTDVPDTKRALGFWTDDCAEWFRVHGRPTEIRGLAYLAAVVAHGDIPFIQGDHFGNVWTIALAAYGGGRPATDAWRRVLRGELLPPVAGKPAPRSPAVVRFG